MKRVHFPISTYILHFLLHWHLKVQPTPMIRYGLYWMQPFCLLFGAGVPVLTPKDGMPLPCFRLLLLPLPLPLPPPLLLLIHCAPTLRLLRINAVVAMFPFSPSKATKNQIFCFWFLDKNELNQGGF